MTGSGGAGCCCSARSRSVWRRVAAAYAQNPEQLIAARALLGIGGATLMPSTLALIRNMFHDPAQRSKAIAFWSAVMMGGISLGPVLGGFLLEHFWWGSVFLINTPAMVLLLVLAPVLLPEFKAPDAGRFDLVGSVLSLAAVLPVIWGIKELAAHGVAVLPVVAIRGRPDVRRCCSCSGSGRRRTR